MDTWKLATIRVKQADKIARESQVIQQALAARKNSRRESKQKFSLKIQAIKGLILCSVENLYCRTLGFFYSRSC